MPLDTGILVCPRGSFMKYVNSVLFMALFFDTSYAQDLRHCASHIFLSGWVAYVNCVSFPFKFPYAIPDPCYCKNKATI